MKIILTKITKQKWQNKNNIIITIITITKRMMQPDSNVRACSL